MNTHSNSENLHEYLSFYILRLDNILVIAGCSANWKTWRTWRYQRNWKCTQKVRERLENSESQGKIREFSQSTELQAKFYQILNSFLGFQGCQNPVQNPLRHRLSVLEGQGGKSWNFSGQRSWTPCNISTEKIACSNRSKTGRRFGMGDLVT